MRTAGAASCPDKAIDGPTSNAHGTMTFRNLRSISSLEASVPANEFTCPRKMFMYHAHLISFSRRQGWPVYWCRRCTHLTCYGSLRIHGLCSRGGGGDTVEWLRRRVTRGSRQCSPCGNDSRDACVPRDRRPVADTLS